MTLEPLVRTGGVFCEAMSERDLDQVLYNETVSYPHPWTLRIFRDCLHSGYECRVLRQAGRVVAHGVLSVVLDESHLLTLCVHPAHRRMGLGRRLLNDLLERARQEGARSCFLEVRPSNTGARELYYGAGFVQVGERRRYYPVDPRRGEREDALILSRRLN